MDIKYLVDILAYSKGSIDGISIDYYCYNYYYKYLLVTTITCYCYCNDYNTTSLPSSSSSCQII